MTTCPLCNASTKYSSFPHADVPSVRVCRECGAYYGSVDSWDAVLRVVDVRRWSHDTPAARQVYFDLDVDLPGGRDRTHGWMDRRTRLLVQLG
jgi:hypothetical protein